jgi:hypothetical protein
MVAEEFSVFLPRQPSPTSTTIQPFPPESTDSPIELLYVREVRWSSVVLVVASEFGVEGFLLLFHLLVSVLLAPVGDCRQVPTEPFAHRPHVAVNFPLRLRVPMCVKPRRSKVPGFFPCRFAFPSAFLPNSTGLVFSGCSVRPYFGKPFRQDVHHLFRVLPVLEAQNGIIGETDLVSFPFQPRFHHFLEPFVEDGSAGKCWPGVD